MQPWDQDFTHSHAGVDLKRTEMPKIDEVSESENISRSEETVKNGEQNAIVTKTEDVSLRRLILQCLILTHWELTASAENINKLSLPLYSILTAALVFL